LTVEYDTLSAVQGRNWAVFWMLESRNKILKKFNLEFNCTYSEFSTFASVFGFCSTEIE